MELGQKTVDALPATPVVTVATPQKQISQRRRRLMWRFSGLGWFTVDAIFGFVAVLMAYVISPRAELFQHQPEKVDAIFLAIPFALLVGTIGNIAALHDPRYPRRWTDLVGRSLFVVATALLIMTLELLFVHYLRIGRYIIFLSAIITVFAMVASRLVVWHYSRSFAQTICFLGDDRFCFNATSFLDERSLPFRVKSYQPDDEVSLRDWAVDSVVDEIVFDQSSFVDDESLLDCLDAGVKISTYADFIEDNYHLVPVEEISADWLFSARLELAHPFYYGVKRAVDFIAGLIGLIVTAPVMLVVMALIKWESPGPALYSQVRVGQFNRPFRIYKLRTMVQDAEKDGAQWAAKKDHRITRLGGFLRKTRFDEVPQFWNVVRGEMSLVGPRPERPEFVEQLGHRIPFYVQRHLVKPGLTGWAQINYPYGASIEDTKNKLKYDLFYIKRASVGLDAQIFLRTIGAMMKGSR